MSAGAATSGGLKESLKNGLKRLGLYKPAVRVYESLHAARKVPGAVWGELENRRLRGREARNGLPVPEPELLYLVAGSRDVRWFLEGGRRGFETITDILRRNGVSLDELEKVLDFGSGCGRVLRHWHASPNVRVYGTDYNASLIEWCRSNLAFAGFGVNRLSPPLDYPDAEFDLVYAFSVFTHLTEELQAAWMAELRRVIKPGGYLLLTTHGRHYLGDLSPEERAAFERDEMVIRYPETAGSNECATFHPERYVREKMAEGFEVLDFVPEGARGNPSQDAYLLRKK
jgi:SAM-dependent methyltransferase